MDITLSEIEARVVGSLIEKQMATPEYYPLTMNALQNACNQKSNREPVVDFGEEEILDALESLRRNGLALRVSGGSGRVPKHRQVLDESLRLSKAQKAALCVLMLRGPRTIGEIRSRSGRLYEFADLSEVESALEAMRSRDDGPIVVRLPRQPGRKEARYAHLLSGPVDAAAYESASPSSPRAEPLAARVEQLEAEAASLRAELEALRQQFEIFRKQFE